MLKNWEHTPPSHVRNEEAEAAEERELHKTFIVRKQRHQQPRPWALTPRRVVAAGMLFILHGDSQI